MDYKLHYDKLVERAKNRNLNGYIEKHHIIPRSLGGTDANDNIVELTAREHFIAHLLLIKIHPNKMKLVFALNMMCVEGLTQHRSHNRMYGWLKEKFSKTMSEAQTGKNNSQFGTKWIHSDDLKISKKIPKGDEIPDGWKLGRKIKFDKIKKVCKNCGQENCLRPEICSNNQRINRFIKSFNFNKHVIGSVEFYNEYDKIVSKLEDEYKSGLSHSDMAKMYNIKSSQSMGHLLRSVGIETRTFSECAVLSAKKR